MLESVRRYLDRRNSMEDYDNAQDDMVEADGVTTCPCCDSEVIAQPGAVFAECTVCGFVASVAPDED